MTNTNTQQQTFKVGDMVFLTQQKQSGKIIGMTRTLYPNTVYKVEIIKSFNKNTQERLTQLLEVKCTDVEPYRKPKRKTTHKKYNPNEMTHMVREFQTLFNQPVADKPIPLTLKRITDRGVFKLEEIIEGIQKTCSNESEFKEAFEKLIDGANRAFDKSAKDEYPQNDIDRLIGQTDALNDELYFVHGDFVEVGVLPFNLFKTVHEANLSKLFEDEKGNLYAKFREGDNKVLKSPRFTPPEPKLKEEILRQIKVSNK